ncbi:MULTISPECIES: hypothetical protein [unclassified Roseitalea]|uniref:hypothetical protein n=1 Tax=unclassified Roseitalea TaxID=2639107 RepID=UPI0027401EDE|nr:MULTISPECIES: hypothetical protein [unclassified Roseitalea]
MFYSPSTEEVVATLRAADALASVPWAEPLLGHTADTVNNLRIRLDDRTAGRPVRDNERGLLFELRYAEALHHAAARAEYEVNSGVGDTTVDFCVLSEPTWLVELVGLRASEAVQAATNGNGVFASLVLSSPQPNATLAEQIQSEEAEIIKAQERIGEKAFRNGAPVKFPKPAGKIHMIMVDARGFIGIGGDRFDWCHIASGPNGLPDEAIRSWPNPMSGVNDPIAGLFEERCRGRAAPTIRERIHIIGFVCEETFEPGEIASSTFYCFNPHLVSDTVRAAYEAWPLRSPRPQLRRPD